MGRIEQEATERTEEVHFRVLPRPSAGDFLKGPTENTEKRGNGGERYHGDTEGRERRTR